QMQLRILKPIILPDRQSSLATASDRVIRHRNRIGILKRYPSTLSRRSHQRKRPLRRSHHHQRLSKPAVGLVTLPTTRHRIISPDRPLKTYPAILHPLHRRLSDRGAPVIRKPLKPFLEIVLKLLRREPHPTLTALEVVHIRLNLT